MQPVGRHDDVAAAAAVFCANLAVSQVQVERAVAGTHKTLSLLTFCMQHAWDDSSGVLCSLLGAP